MLTCLFTILLQRFFLVGCQVGPSKIGGYISLGSSSMPCTSCRYGDPSRQVVFTLVVSQLSFPVVCIDFHKTPGLVVDDTLNTTVKVETFNTTVTVVIPGMRVPLALNPISR